MYLYPGGFHRILECFYKITHKDKREYKASNRKRYEGKDFGLNPHINVCEKRRND